LTRSSATVWVLDDHHLRRAGLIGLMESWAEKSSVTIKAVETLQDLAPPPSQPRGQSPCACVLNIGALSLEGEHIWAAIDTLVEAMNGHPLVVISEQAAAAHVDQAIRHGIRGLIPTRMAPDIAIAALEFILSGGSYFPHALDLVEKKPAPIIPILLSRAADMADQDLEDCDGLIAGAAALPLTAPDLTPRQKDVLAALRSGHSNKEIARQLELSEATVKIHVRQLIRKFGAANRTQVALMASQFEGAKHPA